MGKAKDRHLSIGQATMMVEAYAITAASQRLGPEFAQAVEVITDMSNSGRRTVATKRVAGSRTKF